jgi:hypothetical protein
MDVWMDVWMDGWLVGYMDECGVDMDEKMGKG